MRGPYPLSVEGQTVAADPPSRVANARLGGAKYAKLQLGQTICPKFFWNSHKKLTPEQFTVDS